MIDLGLNQYKITEIKYELKEGKTVIFKLRDFNLEDVEIIEEEVKEETKESRSEFEKRKTREMIDVAKTSLNFSALGKEKKEAARDSMKGFLKEARPIKNEYLEKSKKMISEDAEKDSKIIKERIEDRNQDKYYKLDPNDEYSSIKSLNDVDGKPLEIKEIKIEENKIENETNG